MQAKEGRAYAAYLLRVWRARSQGGAWRVQLEPVGSERNHTFASPEALCAYLRRPDEPNENDAPPGGR